MSDILIYILKVILFHSICYAVYWTVLRKSNYFLLNRAYLLSTMILGFIAPAIMLPLSGLPVEHMIAEMNLVERTFSETQASVSSNSLGQDRSKYLGVHEIIKAVYLAGVLILTLRCVLSIVSIWRLKAQGVENPGTTPKVITIKESMSFSFISTILLQESANPAVLLHEKCHVLGRHWIDLILVEIVCVFCWMSPVVWLYRRSLKQQHEYLADSYVLSQGVSREDYLLCFLNSICGREPIGPVNKFSSQSLKQRISMMTNEKFLPYPKLIYSAIVPVVAVLFLSFSGSKGSENSIDTAKMFVIDAGHGGDDNGAISSSGRAEKEVALNLARRVQEIGKAKGMNIMLTRTSDQQMSLEERVAFSKEAKADVFLSLHIGYDKERAQKGAGMYVSEQNIKYTDSKRMAAILANELSGIKELERRQTGNFDAIVLKQNSAASTILEIGFLSDEQDAKFISVPMNQRLIAEKIVSALAKY